MDSSAWLQFEFIYSGVTEIGIVDQTSEILKMQDDGMGHLGFTKM